MRQGAGAICVNAKTPVGFAVLVVAAAFVFAAPSSAQTPEQDFAAHDPASQLRVDHSDWQAFLDRHLTRGADDVNRVSYAAVSSQDRAALRAYLEAMSRVTLDILDRDEQFAFWVNLYNALSVDLILTHYPVKSIRDIDRFSLLSRWPWNDVLIEVKGRGLTLDNIEHDILRPIWKEPRIHYVVNCAAVGCPQLPARALSSNGLEGQLDAAARAFINHPRGVHLEGDRLVVSRLYKWYAGDFGGSDARVIGHLGKYATGDLAENLGKIDRIGRYQYDWSLNEAGSR